MTSKQAVLQIKSSLLEVDYLLAWFHELAYSSVSELEMIQCQTVLVEAFTNVVRHAHYNKPEETPVDIEVKIFPDQLELSVWDQGDGFDFEQRMNQLPELPDLDSLGGRGLFLIKRMTDQAHYRVADQRNCLILIKHRSTK